MTLLTRALKLLTDADVERRRRITRTRAIAYARPDTRPLGQLSAARMARGGPAADFRRRDVVHELVEVRDRVRAERLGVLADQSRIGAA